MSHDLCQGFLPHGNAEPPQWLCVCHSGRETCRPSDGDLPSLQWHVAIEHPAVLKLNGLRRGGQVIGRGGGGVDLTPPVGQRVPVEGVG